MSATLSRRLARVALLEPIRSLPPSERRGIADTAECAEEFAQLPACYQQLIAQAEVTLSRLLAAKQGSGA